MKDVHFVFSSHSSGQKYHLGKELASGTKTFLMESFKGGSAESVLERLKKEAKTPREKSRLKFLEDAYARGIRVKVGEEPSNAQQKNKLDRLLAKEELAKKLFEKKASLKNYILYLQAFASAITYRNELIRNKVHDLKKNGKIEAEYGATHSTLRWKLRKEGVEASANMHQRVFPHYSRVLRMLELGIKPSKRDYEKAMVSHFVIKKMEAKENLLRLFGVGEVSEKSNRFLTLFSSVLIDQLSASQLKSITTKLSFEKLFEFNGFSAPWKLKPSERQKYILQVRSFLKQHSAFYNSVIAAGKRV